MPPTEYITHEHASPDAWVCRCGNTPSADGFYACDALGMEVEPTSTQWTTDCYVCGRCGRIINQTNLEVVGRRVMRTEGEKPAR